VIPEPFEAWVAIGCNADPPMMPDALMKRDFALLQRSPMGVIFADFWKAASPLVIKPGP